VTRKVRWCGEGDFGGRAAGDAHASDGLFDDYFGLGFGAWGLSHAAPGPLPGGEEDLNIHKDHDTGRDVETAQCGVEDVANVSRQLKERKKLQEAIREGVLLNSEPIFPKTLPNYYRVRNGES